MAGALSSDTDRAAASTAELGLTVDRPYGIMRTDGRGRGSPRRRQCPIKWSMVDVKLCH